MKKKISKQGLQYRFDRLLSRGPIAMTLLLFALMIVAVVIIGVIAYFVADDGGVIYQIWNSLMHTLDSGNLAGNSTDNILYLIMMILATLCGLFITSLLIGIIANAVEKNLIICTKEPPPFRKRGILWLSVSTITFFLCSTN